jgi:hypothetical protein
MPIFLPLIGLDVFAAEYAAKSCGAGIFVVKDTPHSAMTTLHAAMPDEIKLSSHVSPLLLAIAGFALVRKP